MKRPRDRSLEGYQEPKRQKGRGDWTLEDYRGDGKLLRPEALARIQEREQPADHPHTFKVAWAVDRARSGFDKQSDLLLLPEDAEHAKNLIHRLEQEYDNDRQYKKVSQEMKDTSKNNKYVKEVVNEIEKGLAKGLSSNNRFYR